MTPPSEPPIFEIPPSVGVVDVNEPIFIHIAASRPERADTEGLEVYVDNLPSGSRFNRGRPEGDRWIFTPADFGDVELELPPGFSGRLDLVITAVADGTSRRRSLVVDIQSNTTDVVTTGQTTMITRETPATTEESQEETAPATTEDTPVNTEGTPPVTVGTPTATGETTLNTGETPGVTITRDTPVSTKETTTVNAGETPEATGEVPTITRDTPGTPEIGTTTDNGRNSHY